MKKTIRLTESELKGLIKNILNEVKYGGESFHGDNPVDWSAMRNLRTFSQKPLKNYDKSNRNRNNARDFFDKEFGQYKVDGDDNNYQFPNKDEYDKADKWMDDTFDKAWDKADRALDNAREVKRAEGAKLLRQLVANRETFWTKKWQQNGYYPITRWEYDEENGCYRTIWGQKVRSVDIDNVMRAATSDDLLSNEPFNDEHVYEEDGVKFYPIYHADVDSALAEAVMHAIKKVLNEGDDTQEFTFSDSKEMKPGLHQQRVFYNGELVGFLSTRERNPLAPLEEYYHIPDVDYGIDNNGFIDFKIFKDDENEAMEYTRRNFDKIVDLIKNGDWD